MRDFQFYVTDDRYAVPTLHLVTTMTDADARRIAAGTLSQPHHTAVEVWERGELLFTVRDDMLESLIQASRRAIEDSRELLRRGAGGALISGRPAPPSASKP